MENKKRKPPYGRATLPQPGGNATRNRSQRVTTIMSDRKRKKQRKSGTRLAGLSTVVILSIITIYLLIAAIGDTKPVPGQSGEAMPALWARQSISVYAASTPASLPSSTPTPEPYPVIMPSIMPEPTSLPTVEPTANITPEPTRALLKEGMSGDDIRVMQARLVELGYLPEGAANGAFDKATKAAIKTFQGQNSLDDDGIAGNQTLAALYSEFAKPYVAPQLTNTEKSKSSIMVYHVSKGSCYHSSSRCSNMKNPQKITLDKAKQLGLRACSKCY